MDSQYTFHRHGEQALEEVLARILMAGIMLGTCDKKKERAP
jgi:hypothetical protein